MDTFRDVADTLATLLAKHGAADPTFQRMVGVHRDVADVLGTRETYDRTVTARLRGNVATMSAGPIMIMDAGN